MGLGREVQLLQAFGVALLLLLDCQQHVDAFGFRDNITPRDIAFTSPWGITNYNGLLGYNAAEQIHQQIVKAIEDGPPIFKQFCGTGDLEADRRECAAFFANVCKETGGLGVFEESTSSTYCTHLGDGDSGLQAAGEEFPCCTQEDRTTVCTNHESCPFGCNMHGRGAIQLTWNMNYGRFSEFYYGDRDVLLRNPEKVEGSGATGWAASIWFWMMGQDYGGNCPPPSDFSSFLPVGHQSCHNAMHATGGGGFGQTIRIINGGYEACKKTGAAESAIYRVEYFLSITTDWNVPPAKGCSVGQADCDVSGGEFFGPSGGLVGNPQIAFKQDSTNCPSCGIPQCTKSILEKKEGICGWDSSSPSCQDPLENVAVFDCHKCAGCDSQSTPPWAGGPGPDGGVWPPPGSADDSSGNGGSGGGGDAGGASSVGQNIFLALISVFMAASMGLF